jgi:hypothetical protein
MQAFGRFVSSIEIEYLAEQYIYIQNEDEVIDSKDLENMLKKKRKHVAGTIFLYNPCIAPLGYTTDSSLESQGYEFKGQFDELEFDKNCGLFSSAIKDGYRGKLIEIKYLFALNKDNIEPTPILEEFDSDLDRYSSNQLTRYDKTINYLDIPNIRLSGKFVFFASGNKFDRHHKAIIAYARALSAQVQKLGKEIAFMYDRNHDEDEALEIAYFLPPIAGGKLKDIRANAFKKCFLTNPPTTLRIG